MNLLIENRYSIVELVKYAKQNNEGIKTVNSNMQKRRTRKI